MVKLHADAVKDWTRETEVYDYEIVIFSVAVVAAVVSAVVAAVVIVHFMCLTLVFEGRWAV